MVRTPSKREQQLAVDNTKLQEKILELTQKLKVKEELYGIELASNHELRNKDVQWALYYKEMLLSKETH